MNFFQHQVVPAFTQADQHISICIVYYLPDGTEEWRSKYPPVNFRML
jgi:hypothetical protein